MTPNRIATLLALTIAAATGSAQLNLAEKCEHMGQFAVFLSLAERAGLIDELRQESPITLFVPNDEAFATVDPATLAALKRHPDLLKLTIEYHMRPGKVYSFNLQEGTHMMANGERAAFRVGGNGAVKVDGAVVLLKDIECSNGLIYVINEMNVPPNVRQELIRRDGS